MSAVHERLGKSNRGLKAIKSSEAVTCSSLTIPWPPFRSSDLLRRAFSATPHSLLVSHGSGCIGYVQVSVGLSAFSPRRFRNHRYRPSPCQPILRLPTPQRVLGRLEKRRPKSAPQPLGCPPLLMACPSRASDAQTNSSSRDAQCGEM